MTTDVVRMTFKETLPYLYRSKGILRMTMDIVSMTMDIVRMTKTL